MQGESNHNEQVSFDCIECARVTRRSVPLQQIKSHSWQIQSGFAPQGLDSGDFGCLAPCWSQPSQAAPSPPKTA